jgi:ferredoxin-NADP reductase/MOSC domain-containing protein YiiM
MKLVNFSIGQIQTIQVGSEVIRTAYMKAPVAEPWFITEDGAFGDKRAAHPDKIYAYARAGYDYWGADLKVDPAKWPDGFFGENLTLDELDEEDVRVGDVFALGDEVRLSVAGARTPCVKLAWRLSQPRSFQKRFALSRRTGAYFNVVAPGTVRPGDRLECVHHDPSMPSIADVCDMVASHHSLPLEPLKRLLGYEGLSHTNRLLLGAKFDAAERAADQIDGRWPGWRSFLIERIVTEAPDICSFYLSPVDGEAVCQPRPGQFVTVRMTLDDGSTVARCWSLSAFSHDMAGYRLTVRRQAGAGSNGIHQAQVGSTVMLRPPAGEFTLDMGSFRPLVLIAAGIGITPLLAMLQAHLSRKAAAPAYLIYGARTPAELAFREELEVIAAAHPDVHLSFVYSQSEEGGRPAGRITPDLVLERLQGLHVVLQGHRVELPWYEGDIYLCGPGEFCTHIRDELIGRGANPDNIFSELFTAAALEETGIDRAEVHFARSDRLVEWKAEDGLSLLDLAEQAGIVVDSECRAGSCLTCKHRLIEGDSTAATGDGHVLLCIGRPKSPSLVIEA